MKQGFGYERNIAPVKQGEELTVTIEGVGEKGDGIAKIKGFVLFVPNTKQGDNVLVRVNRVLSKVGFAEVIGKSGSTSQSSTSPAEEETPSEDVSEEEYSQQEDSEGF